jgi:hypothetical protein
MEIEMKKAPENINVPLHWKAQKPVEMQTQVLKLEPQAQV